MEQTARRLELFTYQDYLTWPEDERWELIDGQPYNMTPAPVPRHQEIVSRFDRRLGDEIEKRKCKLFIAPTDVVLDEHNVVQPDIFIVCDTSIVTDKNIQGVPDLIIEVLSPSTSLKDKREKRKLYERFGVAEYILVYPDMENVERYVMKDGVYQVSEILNWDEVLRLDRYDIELNLWEIFGKEKLDTKRTAPGRICPKLPQK